MGAPSRNPALARPGSHPPLPSPSPSPSSRLGDREESDPAWRAVELAQRGRMILDVSAADLDAAEAAYGPFHPTASYFRSARDEGRRAWDRLRAQYGGATLEAALNEPPVTHLVLREGTGAGDGDGHDRGAAVILIPIGGRTYRVQW